MHSPRPGTTLRFQMPGCLTSFSSWKSRAQRLFLVSLSWARSSTYRYTTSMPERELHFLDKHAGVFSREPQWWKACMMGSQILRARQQVLQQQPCNTFSCLSNKIRFITAQASFSLFFLVRLCWGPVHRNAGSNRHVPLHWIQEMMETRSRMSS